MIAGRHIVVGMFALLLLVSGAVTYAVLASQDEAIDEALDRLSTYEGAIATQPQLEAELERVRQQSASLAGLVPGTGASIAAATIQNDLRTIASRAGAEVRSTQNLPASMVETFEQIEISAEVTLPMNRLKDLLYQIETHTPYLFLQRLNIEVPQTIAPRADGAQPRVDVHMVVRGYRWVGT